MRVILTVVACLAVGVPAVPRLFSAESARAASSALAPDVLALAGVTGTLALYLATSRRRDA